MNVTCVTYYIVHIARSIKLVMRTHSLKPDVIVQANIYAGVFLEKLIKRTVNARQHRALIVDLITS